LEARRPEQSGFTHHRSTVDRIVTLSTLLQTRRKFNKPLCIAYVDLKSAFDSVDRESLWLLLRRRGLPDKLVELTKDLYTDTCSCVLADGMRSEWFQVLSGVRQGCIVAPDLFLNPMYWILNRTVEQTSLGVSIGKESFSDLDYADDVMVVTLLAEMLETLVAGLLVLQDEATPLGLQVNRTKTKIQHVGEPRPTQSTVQVAAENVDLVDEFIYLGSLISHDGGSEAEILRRIGISREYFSLLEKNIGRSHILILTDTKVHLYMTYILPVLLYGCETWTVRKTLAKHLDAFDTCMVSAENVTDFVHQAHYK